MSAIDDSDKVLMAARQFATAAGAFKPKDAISYAMANKSVEKASHLAAVLSALRADCLVEDSAEGQVWTLLPASRRHYVQAFKTADSDWSGVPAFGDADSRLLREAVRGEDGFAPGAILSLQIQTDEQAAAAEQVCIALDSAGPAAPAYEQLPELKGKLNRFHARRRSAELAAGLLGRSKETKDLLDWALKPTDKLPAQTVFVTGLPGIGKSFLLDWLVENVTRAAETSGRAEPIVVRLDFDRRGLAVEDPDSLLDEISRQVGDQAPEAASAMRRMRLEQASARWRQDQLKSDAPSSDLAIHGIGAAVRGAGRSVLLLLDTMEAVRRRGESHPARLFDLVDQLVGAGMTPISVISAGRPESLPPKNPESGEFDRIAKTIDLAGLEDPDAKRLLEKLNAPTARIPRMLEVARGNPLLLRLAARAGDTGALDDTGLKRAIQAAPASGEEATQRVIAAYLYRSVLSRIDDDADLRRIVHPGLVMREISVAAIRDVLGPALHVDTTGRKAERMFEELVTHHWLVDLVGDVAIHRADIRSYILPMIYADNAEDAAKVDRKAAGWYAKNNNPLMSLYHRLQLTRFDRKMKMPAVPAALAARFGADMISDLPEAAQDYVHVARGERSEFGRSGNAPATTGGSIDARAIADLEGALSKGDAFEAHAIFQAGFRGEIPHRSAAGEAALSYYWFVGRWSAARRRFKTYSDGEIAGILMERSSQPVAWPLLEMSAEFRFDSLVEQFVRNPVFFQSMAEQRARRRRTSLEGAALDFAMIAASGRAKISLPSLNIAEAVWSSWTDSSRSGFSFGQKLALERIRPYSRMCSALSASSAIADVVVAQAQVLSRLNPYAAVLDRYAKLKIDATLSKALPAVCRRMASPDLPLPLLDVVRAWPDNLEGMADFLGALGLTASWSGAFAFFRNPADLVLMAASAERWRRTAAGAWSFGANPPGWVSGPDHGLQHSIDWLMAKADPAAQARRQLRFWANPEREGRSLDQPESGKRGEAVEQKIRVACAGIEESLAPPDPRQPADGWANAARSAAEQIVLTFPGGVIAPLAVLASEAHRQSETGTATTSTPTGGTTIMNGTNTRPATRQTTRALEETIGRLDAHEKRNQFGFAEQRIDAGHAILKEAGLNTAAAKRALKAGDLRNLEKTIRPSELEAIVKMTNRPPLVVKNGLVEYVPLSTGPGEFPDDIEMRIHAVEPLIASVGRIVFINNDMSWGGTGWVVDRKKPGYLTVVTNRHVAKIVARRNYRGEGVYMLSPGNALYGALIDFSEELNAPADVVRSAEIEKFIYLADDASADIALGLIKTPGDFHVGPIELGKDGEDGEPVGAVGYPAKDSRNDSTQMEKYFRGLYEVKRFSPGLLRVKGKAQILGHDCTTLGGNSGSPIFSLTQKKAVALHFAGEYGVGNSAVRVSTLKDLLAGNKPPQLVLADKFKEAADGQHQPEFFAGRKGYDPDFLDGHAMPWPKLPKDQFTLAEPSDATSDRPNELRYTHFSVLFCTDRKSPVVTAVNIDGEKSKQLKRENDRWFYDLRIPRDAQIGQEAYADPAIDRGHMVRREDPNWGTAQQVAQANLDTFHYTNSALQHSELNRSRATWQGLENYILDSARTEGFKACVLTGPVFTDDDPPLAEASVPVPLEFWKVVAMLAPGSAGKFKLHATAYLLSQGRLIQKLMQKRSLTEGVEGFVYGAYKTFQIAIADLEEATGYDFGAAVRRADPLNKVRKQESVGLRPVFVEIEKPEHVIL